MIASNFVARERLPTLIDTAFSVLIAYAWCGASGNFLFLPGAVPIVTNVSWKCAMLAGAMLWGGVRLWNRLPAQRNLPARKISVPQIRPGAFAIAFRLLLLTDFVHRRGSLRVDGQLVVVLGLAGLLISYLWAKRTSTFRLETLFRWQMLLVAQIVLSTVFLREADGRLLWSDDHPSFLYRLAFLKRHFPDIIFYNSDWNAAYPTREIFPTGALSLFFLALPALPFLSLDTLAHASYYTWLIPYLVIFLIPWSVYLAARLLTFSSPSAVIAGMLAIAPSTTLFEFALKFGTLPFVIAAGLVPLGLACLFRLSFRERPSNRRFILLSVVVLFLGLCWHLMAVAYLPILLLMLRHLRQLRTAGRLPKLIVTAALTLVLLAPSAWFIVTDSPILPMLTGASLPGSETSGTGVHAEKEKPAEKKRKKDVNQPPRSSFGHVAELRQNFSHITGSANPLLLALAIPAFVLLPRGPKRFVVGGTALWTIVVAVVGQEIKPQLEFHRFALVADLLAALACGHLVELMFQEQKRFWEGDGSVLSIRSLLPGSALVLCIGGVLATLLTAGTIYGNKSEQRFAFAPPELPSFIEAIRAHGGPGRVFFAGFILHDFGATHYDTQDGGHIAPLPMFTGHPMYAFHYAHMYWATVDPIPDEFRERDDAGIEEFLDLINATAVVTFKREWTRYCKGNEDRYTRVWHHGRFHLFTRKPTHEGWFLRGSGELEEKDSSLVITPTADDIVVKYRWYPRLTIDRPDIAEILEEPMFREEIGVRKRRQVSFIRIKTRADALGNRPRITVSY